MTVGRRGCSAIWWGGRRVAVYLHGVAECIGKQDQLIITDETAKSADAYDNFCVRTLEFGSWLLKFGVVEAREILIW